MSFFVIVVDVKVAAVAVAAFVKPGAETYILARTASGGSAALFFFSFQTLHNFLLFDVRRAVKWSSNGVFDSCVHA